MINNNLHKTILTLMLSFFLLNFTFAQEKTEFMGVYQSTNLVISNPFSSSGAGFCITKITVNNKAVTDEFKSSAFELNFTKYGIKKGENIKVTIYHKAGCNPKAMNPDALIPRSTFKCHTVTADRNHMLKWVTSGENGALLFKVEQYKWKKWVPAGEIMGQGTNSTNYYSLKVPVHSGVNKFRIKQIDFTNRPHYSKSTIYRSRTKPISLLIGANKKVGDKITFSAVTSYEVYDFYGKIIKKGTSDVVNVKQLTAGTYFINYDNSTSEFIKK